jgi:hypothetical protein
MACLLIGSSNVARFYKPENFKDHRPYQMLKCTTVDSFTALMNELEVGNNNRVIISVFENIIIDATKTAKNDEERNGLIKSSIGNSLDLIGKTAKRLPDSKFCIVMPLMRPAVKWFQEMLGSIDSDIRDALVATGAENITRVNCVCHSLQQFEKDGIHLTADAGVIFVESILKLSEEIFDAAQVDDDETPKTGGSNEMTALVSVLKTRFEADNLMFARIREEIDSTANRF